ncbi:MAG: SAM hydrolase/SAM-dependent halogenase family protein [Nitrospiria bacterium]
MEAPIITLTTDFGYKDYFVGSMKGVILGINPEARIVDISHEVDPQDVDAAAYLIKSSYHYFPAGTIHVVVVDPGVGSPRKPILVVGKRDYFVGPDNGVFSYIYSEIDSLKIIHITSKEYFLKDTWRMGETYSGELGSTFHGREIFAPVAAWLSKGIDPANFGGEIQNPVRLPLAEPRPITSPSGQRALEGRVIYIDRFGNLITNITRLHLQVLSPSPKEGTFRINLKGRTFEIKRYYAEGIRGKPVALVNSCGHLEVFIYLGNAHEKLEAAIGDPILLTTD